MRFKALIIPLIFSLTLVTANAFDICSALFVSRSELQSFVSDYRKVHLLPVESHVSREESGFYIEAKLGESGAQVYLASDPITKTTVVLKMVSSLRRLWSEVVVTEYLLANGETVPKIFNVFIKHSSKFVVVREYFEGLTGAEVKRDRARVPRELADTLPLLDLEMKRLKNLYFGHESSPSVLDWYQANSARLEEKYPEIWSLIEEMNQKDPNFISELNKKLELDDFSKENFLFDVRRNAWIAFDP